MSILRIKFFRFCYSLVKSYFDLTQSPYRSATCLLMVVLNAFFYVPKMVILVRNITILLGKWGGMYLFYFFFVDTTTDC